MGKFKFNGKSSEDFGLVIQTPPVYVYPERDVSVEHIPGRNGDVIIDNNCYKNVTRRYSIAKGYTGGKGYYMNFQSILEWLSEPKGKYVKLEDTYDSEVFRLASFKNNGTFTDFYDQMGSAEIQFDCKPQRYLRYGEKEHYYQGANNQIENAYCYVALPLIKVESINTTYSTVLMMSVFNKYGEATSSVTFQNYEGTLIIDSEEQIVYNELEENKSDVVGLNGKSFPEFQGGINTISFNKYNIKTHSYNAYSTLLATSQESSACEYKTYALLEASQQDKIMVKAYNSLIDTTKESYEASSMQYRFSTYGETYEAISFNDILNTNVRVFQFSADKAADIEADLPEWLYLDGKDLKINIDHGFFIYPILKDSRIKFLKKGEKVNSSDINFSSSNVIYYYPDEDVTDNPNHDGAPIYNLKSWGIAVSYQDIPSWLTYKIKYGNDTSPTKVTFYRNQNGYYFREKDQMLFGKDSWKYYDDSSETEFDTYEWNTGSKAFTTNKGVVLPSKTKTFTYIYYDTTPEQLIPYGDLYTETTDEKGEKIRNITNKAHFIAKDSANKTLENIQLFAKDNGYYYVVYGKNSTEWSYKQTGDSLLGGNTVAGNQSFQVYYLENIPNYENQEGWPEWLSPYPILSPEGSLKPTSVKLKVLKDSYYRMSETSEDKTGSASEWIPLSAGDELTQYPKTPSVAYYVYQIVQPPTPFAYNRSYTYKHGETVIESQNPPEWLGVEYSEEKFEPGSDTPKKITYKVNKKGYYKWDNNTVWVKKNTEDIGSILVEVGGQDNNTFYYLEELPAYDTSAYIKTQVKTDDVGNPDEIIYTVLQDGYYRVNNNYDWTYLLANQELLSSKVNGSNSIYRLEDTGEELTDIKLTIKPRWWML